MIKLTEKECGQMLFSYQEMIVKNFIRTAKKQYDTENLDVASLIDDMLTTLTTQEAAENTLDAWENGPGVEELGLTHKE